MIANSSWAVLYQPKREFVNHRYVFAATVLAILFFAPSSQAQTAPALADTRATLLSVDKKDSDSSAVSPEPLRKADALKSSELKPVRFHKIQFIALSAGVYTAAMMDMHQTLHVRNYSWWSETDPMARPFVRLPAPAYYATGLALATGVNWIGWKMGHSRRWHKLAAIPQLMSIGGNTYGYRSNCYSGY